MEILIWLNNIILILISIMKYRNIKQKIKINKMKEKRGLNLCCKLLIM